MFLKRWSRKQLLAWIAGALMLLGFGQAWSLLRNTRNADVEESILEPQEEKECLLTGTVIRQEQVITGDCQISWICRKENGARTAPGEVLFQESSPAVQQWAARETVNAQAERYRSQSLYRRREQLWQAIRSGAAGEETGGEIQALLLAENDGSEHQSETPETTALQTITASQDGVFVQGTDGLETLLTPETPKLTAALLPMKTPPETELGRLITSDIWYFSARWDDPPEPGETVKAKLLGGDFGTCRLTVEQVEKQAEGYRVLCACKERVEAVAMVRQLTVKILSE